MPISDLNNISHTFIIAEAGSNWKCGTFQEDLEQAKKLIDVAVDAGADAVKFQTYRPDTIYVKNAGRYSNPSYNIDEDINELFEKLSMPYEMIPILSDYCKTNNIQFMSTPFSIQDAKEIDPYVEIHKIASFEINHIRLIEFLVKTGKPIIISTGASTYEEIDYLVEYLKKLNFENFALLQCTSKYPSPIDSMNLSVIPKFCQKYNVPIGLSDHSLETLVVPLTAVGFGATIIEKHFTLDRTLDGPDHPFALEPDELKSMIFSIRQADLSKGDGIKKILPVEEENRKFATRSIQAIKNIKKGEILKEGENFEILRPGNRIRGLEPRFLFSINGKKATKDVLEGDGILDFE